MGSDSEREWIGGDRLVQGVIMEDSVFASVATTPARSRVPSNRPQSSLSLAHSTLLFSRVGFTFPGIMSSYGGCALPATSASPLPSFLQSSSPHKPHASHTSLVSCPFGVIKGLHSFHWLSSPWSFESSGKEREFLR